MYWIACQKVLDNMPRGYLLGHHSYCLQSEMVALPENVPQEIQLSPPCHAMLGTLGEDSCAVTFAGGLAEMPPASALPCYSQRHRPTAKLSPLFCHYISCRPVPPHQPMSWRLSASIRLMIEPCTQAYKKNPTFSFEKMGYVSLIYKEDYRRRPRALTIAR